MSENAKTSTEEDNADICRIITALDKEVSSNYFSLSFLLKTK